MYLPPQAAYFDDSRGAWVLSRYADVVAALREPQLWPVAARDKNGASVRDEVGHLRLRGPSQEALSATRVLKWQEQIEPLAHHMLDRLTTQGTVDLLADFALPWCLEFALLVVGAAASDRNRLAALSAETFAATGAPDDSPLRPRAIAATGELERLLEGSPMPMGEPTFVAISQTSPRLLASIWLALYEHPAESARLRANPELWPTAVDELLRFGGIVRRIWREARQTVELGGIRIEAGQRVMLMLARANRDPAQFPEPDRLDITRRVAGQLALGAGRNSCIGTLLIRMGVTVATRALIDRFPSARLSGSPPWCTGSGYGFPASLPIRL